MRREKDPREEYADIIDLPHHVSRRHPQMSLMNRAAQFAPFSALSGYDAVIAEAGRLTEGEAVLEEDRLQELDRKLSMLRECLKGKPLSAGELLEEGAPQTEAGHRVPGSPHLAGSGQTGTRPLPRVRITFFHPDERKEGGRYGTVEGIVRRIDEVEKAVYLQEGTGKGKGEETRIPVRRIAGIEILMSAFSLS